MNDIESCIQSILEQLEEANEDFLALSDDIWLSIDHNDNKALQESMQFKVEYDEKLATFHRLSNEIEELVRNFTGLSRKEEKSVEFASAKNERIIKAFDKKKKHSIHHYFKCGDYRHHFNISIFVY